MNSKKVQKIFPIGLIAVMIIAVLSAALAALLTGLWLLVFVIWQMNKINDIKKSGIRVDGYIVSYEAATDDDIPIFEFVTVTREIITGKPLNETNFYKNRPPQNERFYIMYELHNPAEFIVETGHADFGHNLFLILFALTFVIVGLLSLLNIIHIGTGPQ